jgi:hypothetical protein
MTNKTDEIKYFVKPHTTRPDQKVVTIYCGRELLGSFYMHNLESRRYCVFMSPHIREVYTDYNNPLTPGVIIDLGGDLDEFKRVSLGEPIGKRRVRR